MPSEIRVRRIDPTDAAAMLDMDQLVWSDPQQVPREEALRDVPTRAGFIAAIDGEDVGIAGSWDVEVSVPATGGGASLRPAEGLTWVGVHPDFRRRGVLTALMRHHLRWVREEQGRAISILKASEASIYGRFGYGAATHELIKTFPAGARFEAPAQVEELAAATSTRTTRCAPEQAERVLALARRCGGLAAGHVLRSAEDIARILRDVPQTRVGSEPAHLLWATRHGEDVGCAWFRRHAKWSRGAPDGRLDVSWVLDLDAGARLALGRRLTSFDLMSETVYWTATDDPLLLWQSTQRPHGSGICDDLWLRVTDLSRAVADRGHAADLDLNLRVSDEHLPENAGTWHWSATEGSGSLRPAEGPAELTLDIADLGALWLGDQSVGARVRAGHVLEHRPGAAAELDAALRTPTRPVASVDF